MTDPTFDVELFEGGRSAHRLEIAHPYLPRVVVRGARVYVSLESREPPYQYAETRAAVVGFGLLTAIEIGFERLFALRARELATRNEERKRT